MKRLLSFLLVLSLAGAFAQSPTAADYNLKEGRPYEGTELGFLICCTAVTLYLAEGAFF